MLQVRLDTMNQQFKHSDSSGADLQIPRKEWNRRRVMFNCHKKLSGLSLHVLLIASLVFCILIFLPDRSSAVSSLIVTSPADDGEGTLRQAITAANASSGLDIITFGLPDPGQPILIMSQLPDITDPVIIDGTSQTGVAIQGPVLVDPRTSSISCFAVKAGGCTIKGLTIKKFGTGISIVNVPNNVVQDNSIYGNNFNIHISGEKAANNSVRGNIIGQSRFYEYNYYGVYISNAGNNIIGGPDPDDWNIIGGNIEMGVYIEGEPGHNLIEGNHIGVTDQLYPIYLDQANNTGLQGYVNGRRANTIGVWLNATGGNMIKNNLVSRNEIAGITIQNCTESNYIQGNNIGSWHGDTADGKYPVTHPYGMKWGISNHLGNFNYGIGLLDSSNQVIGGSAGEGNVIANNWCGIKVGGSDNIIQGNDIYLNGYSGYDSYNSGNIFIFMGSGNLIGGNETGQGNFFGYTVHSYSNEIGMAIILKGNVSSTAILKNNFSVGDIDLPIDLGNDGVTLNDPLDSDTGPNGFQNYPILTSAYRLGGSYVITGTLDSVPNASFHLEFLGSGKYLGYKEITTDASGHAAFTAVMDAAGGNLIAAASTDSQNNTSEFSPTVAADNSGIESISVAPSIVSLANANVTASAVFSNPAGSTAHIATWDWGDGTQSSGTVNEAALTVSGTHAYASAGVYSVTLTLADDPVRSGADTRTFNYVVIYDQSSGFVTGGGWIDSPSYALESDSTLTGRATFGFVSKYLKGATVPTGNTEFQFHAGDLNFKSSGYDWLVINQAGANAQFKGTGTINGTGCYKFMLWASDGAQDTFRIKIWTEDASGELIVYDNGINQPIGGGSIMVITKK